MSHRVTSKGFVSPRLCDTPPSRLIRRLPRGSAPMNPRRKGWSILRKRNTHINLRTTPQEKKNIDCRARKCGLSTSEYLRKLAAGYEPKVLPPADFFVLTEALNNIYRELQTRYTPELEGKILRVILRLQEQFLLPGKGEEKTGTPQSLLCGEEEHPRSGESFDACSENDERSVM